MKSWNWIWKIKDFTVTVVLLTKYGVNYCILDLSIWTWTIVELVELTQTTTVHNDKKLGKWEKNGIIMEIIIISGALSTMSHSFKNKWGKYNILKWTAVHRKPPFHAHRASSTVWIRFRCSLWVHPDWFHWWRRWTIAVTAERSVDGHVIGLAIETGCLRLLELGWATLKNNIKNK